MSSLLLNALDQSLCVRLTQTLLHFLWQGLVLALCAWAVTRLCRTANARTRYGIHAVALTLMALCVPITFAWTDGADLSPVDQSVELAESSSSNSTAVEGADSVAAALTLIADTKAVAMPAGAGDARPVAESAAPVVGNSESTISMAAESSFAHWLRRAAPFAAWAYILGLAAMLVRLCCALWGGHRLRRSAAPVRDRQLLARIRQQANRIGLKIVPVVAYCERITIPVVVGILRPMILLPDCLVAGLDPDQLHVILVHEMAHIRRFDLLVNLLQRVLETVLFFHPAVWYASRQLSIERENCCDDAVVQAGFESVQYASTLVRMAELCVSTRRPALTSQLATLAANGGSGTQLKRRVLRLLGDTQRLRLTRADSVTLVLVVGLVLGILAGAWRQTVAAPDATAQGAAAEKVETTTDKNEQTTHFSGRVVDGAGKPVVGAKVWAQKPYFDEWKSVAISDAAGRFQVALEQPEQPAASPSSSELPPVVQLAATADSKGIDWVTFEPAKKPGEISLTLRDDVPIEGRLVTVEGQPAVGATVRILHVVAGDTTKYKTFSKGGSGVWMNAPHDALQAGGPLTGTVVTDQQGRFRLSGIGKERWTRLEVEGAGLGLDRLCVATRLPPTDAPANGALNVRTPPRQSDYYATLTHVVLPGRTLRGQVVDAETKLPVSGLKVSTASIIGHKFKTDKDGRFEIPGCPKGKDYEVTVTPDRVPYFTQIVKAADNGGLDPVDIRLELVHGMVVRGTVSASDKRSPVGASVIYNALDPNDNANKLGEDQENPLSKSAIRDDGTYEIAILPGLGALAVEWDHENLPSATVNVAEVERVLGQKLSYGKPGEDLDFLIPAGRRPMGLSFYKGLKVLNPKGVEDVAAPIDFQLVAGHERKGVIVDVEDKPVRNVAIIGLQANLSETTPESAEFSVLGLQPNRERWLFFYHAERQIGAAVTIPGSETGPLKIRLQPCGTIIGRVLDQNREPLRDANVQPSLDSGPGRGGLLSTGLWETERTDSEGRFRMAGMVPGWPVRLDVHTATDRLPSGWMGNINVEAGKVLDLGELVQSKFGQLMPASPPKVVAPVKSAGDEKKPTDGKARQVQFSGTVVDAAGKPVVAAKVWVQKPYFEEWKSVATADAAGKFQVRLDSAPSAATQRESKLQIAATAEGKGIDWITLDPDKNAGEVAFTLDDDVPVAGRLVSMDGQPAVGATVRIVHLLPNEQRMPKAIRTGGPVGLMVPVDLLIAGGPLVSTVVTDQQGRFRLSGFGTGRRARLEIEGPGIGFDRFNVVARPAPADAPPSAATRAPKSYHTNFTHVVVPSRTLRGVVRDAESQAPVAGVDVTVGSIFGHTFKTDGEGRFEISSCPKGKDYEVTVTPHRVPYFTQVVHESDNGGLEPIDLRISLVHGTVVRGTVSSSDGKSPRGAKVIYNALRPNDNSKVLGQHLANPLSEGLIRDDGTYEIAILQGPGALAVAWDHDNLPSAILQAEEVIQSLGTPYVSGAKSGEVDFLIPVGPMPMALLEFKGVRLLNPKQAGDVAAAIDFRIVAGRELRGTMVDADNNPVRDVSIIGLSGTRVTGQPDSADFSIKAVVPNRERSVLFYHKDRKIAAALTVTGSETDSLTVRLQPTVTVTGRLLDKNRDPLSDIDVRPLLELRKNRGGMSGLMDPGFWQARTGADGRFRIEGMIPGWPAQITARHPRTFLRLAPNRVEAESGKVVDLGDLVAEEPGGLQQSGPIQPKDASKSSAAATSTETKATAPEAGAKNTVSASPAAVTNDAAKEPSKKDQANEEQRAALKTAQDAATKLNEGLKKYREANTEQARKRAEENTAAARKRVLDVLQEASKTGHVDFVGHVVDSQGKPVAGVELWLAMLPIRNGAYASDDGVRKLAVSDEHGKFAFQFAPPDGVGNDPTKWISRARVIGKAPGHGVTSEGLGHFIKVPRPNTVSEDRLLKNIEWLVRQNQNVTNVFKLAPEAPPAQGRLVDLEGRPLANVTINVEELYGVDFVKLTEAFQRSSSDDAMRARQPGRGSWVTGYEWRAVMPPIKTNENGEFLLRGLGKDQIATVTLHGERVAADRFFVLGREMETKRLPHVSFYPNGAQDVYVGTRFTYAAGPAIPVTGVVTEFQSGKPIANATVYVERLFREKSINAAGQLRLRTRYIRATTNDKGEYRLVGMPPGGEHVLEVVAPKSEPWLIASQIISLDPKQDAATQNIQVFRGIWIEGRVTDAQAGEPITGFVDYLALQKNPHTPRKVGLKDGWEMQQFPIDESGKYRVVGLPGPGLLLTRSSGEKVYPVSVGADKIEGYVAGSNYLPTTPVGLPLANWNLVQLIDPPVDAQSHTLDMTLSAGPSVAGSVVGPDDAALSNVQGLGLRDTEGVFSLVKDGKFEVHNYQPNVPRDLFFKANNDSLVGHIHLEGPPPADLKVTLQNAVTVKGRLIDTETETEAVGYQLYCMSSKLGKFRIIDIPTDQNGKFQIKGLLAGNVYQMSATRQRFDSRKNTFTIDLTDAKPGEVIDLEDVTGKKAKAPTKSEKEAGK